MNNFNFDYQVFVDGSSGFIAYLPILSLMIGFVALLFGVIMFSMISKALRILCFSVFVAAAITSCFGFSFDASEEKRADAIYAYNVSSVSNWAESNYGIRMPQSEVEYMLGVNEPARTLLRPPSLDPADDDVFYPAYGVDSSGNTVEVALTVIDGNFKLVTLKDPAA